MASYGTIYQFSFDSVNGADIDIFILKKNYTGARQQRALGRAPVLKRERSGSIFGTSLEIYAECLVDGEFAQLYTSSADEYKVEVYKHQELIWTGFVSPELYSEPDIAPPYDVQIIATDGLGELKNYTFEAMGEKSLKDHLLSLMAHTGLDLPYMRVTTLDYTDGDGAEFFWYLLVDLDYLEGKNCYDVLKILLDSTHAQMTQQDAAWLIARECDYAHLASVNGVDGYEGDNAVVLPVASFGSMQSHKWWPVGQLITTIHPAYKGMTIESERTYKASILQNSDMTYMGGWEAIAEGVTFLTDEGGYALKQAEAAIRQDVNIGILDRGLTLNVSAMLGDGGDGQDDKKLLIYIYALDGTSWVMMYPDGSYWGVGAGPVEMELNDNLSNIDVNIPVNASFSAIRVVLKSAGGWHKIVKSCHLRQSYMPKGEKVALTLANGARGEADDVSVELSNKGIRDYIYRYAVIRDSRLDTAVKVTTYDFPEGSFLDSLMARDYAKSIALPRMKITGVLNVPADGYMPVLFIRDDTFYIPQTYNYDLYNDEVSVELLSIPTAVISVESEKVTELDNASSGGSVGGGGSSGGPSGGGGTANATVDTEMSDTSTNPVQNKAIKAYVDSVDNLLEEKIGNLAEHIDNLETSASKVVIFDATCSSDPWHLNVLQTSTTLEEMAEAINNGSPIYMRFGNGNLVSVGNARVSSDGRVEMHVYLVDAEDPIIRNIYVWVDADGKWKWDSFNSSLPTRSFVENRVVYLEGYAENRAIDALNAAKAYTDEKIVESDDVYEFVHSDGTATADMVTGLASAIADNKLIISGGVTYKHYATQDGMIILISAPAYNIETAAFDVQLLGVMTSTNEVMTESTSVSIPSAVTESTVAGWGFTKNTGTITGIKMNGATKGTSGVVDLGNVLTEHQDISGKQDVLVSGTNIKTINGKSLLGEGNIEIESGGATPRIEMTDATAELEPNKFYVWDNMPESLDLTLGAETSGVMNRYLFQFRNPKDVVTLLTLPDDITWSEDTELDENGMPVMEATAFYRIEIIEGFASLKKWKLAYIVFADAEVERVLMANGVGDGIGITKALAHQVISLDYLTFFENTLITEFDEFQYFRKITHIPSYNINNNFGLFFGCTSLQHLIIPSSAIEIGRAAFMNCTALRSVGSLRNVKKIGLYAFRDSALEGDVDCPFLEGELDAGAFMNTNITSVINLGHVVNMPYTGYNKYGQFAGCKMLTIVNLPATLESMGKHTFNDCISLVTVISEATTPPTITNSTFNGCAALAVIYVPDASVEAYKAATDWNTYADRIKGITELATDNPTLYAEIQQYL